MTNSFDFFVGEWTSTQHRLREVLTGCTEWYEFSGHTRCWSVFDGAGNVDEVTFPTQGFSGLTVRLLDGVTGMWSIYWVNSRTGLALPPVVGRFDDSGTGTFYSDEDYHGQPIKVRFIWSDITDSSCRWEQAFSVDGGEKWEVNWIAQFQRAS